MWKTIDNKKIARTEDYGEQVTQARPKVLHALTEWQSP